MALESIGKSARMAAVLACLAAFQATAAINYCYWTNATGDNEIREAGNWKDAGGNVLTTAPVISSSVSDTKGSILVFTNCQGTLTSSANYQYYGYVFGDGAKVTLGGSKSFYIYNGGVTHTGNYTNMLGYTVYLRSATNVFDIVNANAMVEFNNSLQGGDSRVLLKRGKGTLKVPNSYGSSINNISEILMQGGTFTLSTRDANIKLTDCTITFDGNEPSYIKREKNNDPCTVLPISGGCVRETESVDNTEHGFTDDGKPYTLVFTNNVTDSYFSGTIYSKLSFFWGPSDGSQTFTFAKATHPTTGSLTVSNGTVRLENGAKFTSLASVRVMDGATLDVASGVRNAIYTEALTLDAGATLKVAANTTIAAGAISVDGSPVSAGIYTKDNCGWIVGDGTVMTTDWPADKNDVWNRRDFPAVLAAGTETWYEGAALDGADMSLTAGEGATAVIGPLGVKTAGDGGTYTWSWPTLLYGTQDWVSTNGDMIVVSAPIGSYVPSDLNFNGNGGVTLAVSQDSETRFVFNVPKVTMSAGVTIANPVSVLSGTKFVATKTTTTNTFAGPVTINNKVPTLDKGTWRFTGGVDSTGALNMNSSSTIIVDDKPYVGSARLQNYGTVVLNVPSNNIAIQNHAFAHSGNSRIYTTVPYALWCGGKANDQQQRLSLGFYNNKQNDPSAHQHASGVTWDLCGCDQGIASLPCSTNGAYVTSEKAAQLHYALDPSGQNAVYGYVWYAVTNYVNFTGGAGLTYEGSRTDAMLVNVSTTTGRLEVVSGKLGLAAQGPNVYSGLNWPGGSWPNASAVAVRGSGTLAFGHKDAIGRETDVEFEGTDGRLEIAAGVTVRCRDLYFDGVRQRQGLWGGTGNAAAQHKDARFSGDGLLFVLGDGIGTMVIFR